MEKEEKKGKRKEERRTYNRNQIKKGAKLTESMIEGKFGTFIVLLDSDCMSCFTFALFVTIFSTIAIIHHIYDTQWEL